jgi:hypothetical protein
MTPVVNRITYLELPVLMVSPLYTIDRKCGNLSYDFIGVVGLKFLWIVNGKPLVVPISTFPLLTFLTGILVIYSDKFPTD